MKSNEGRQGKAIQDNSIAVETAPTVEARNSEMGTYFMDSAKKFFTERSLNFNLVDTAKTVARAIPDDIKADVNEIVSEARLLKKKKSLKKLLPLLKIVGAKVAVLAVASLFGLLFLAKKALVISAIAFVLALVNGAGSASGLLGRFSGLFGGKSSGIGHSSYSSGSYGGSSGWSSAGSDWDTHGAYSSPVAQYVAYSGQPQAQQ